MPRPSASRSGQFKRDGRVEIVRQETRWQFDPYTKVKQLGFSVQEATIWRQEFARALLGLGIHINQRGDEANLQQLLRLSEGLPQTVDELLEQLRPALTPDPYFVRQTLLGLKEIGLSMYRGLGAPMREALTAKEVIVSDEEIVTAPPVTFILEQASEEARMPIGWPMIYQQDDRSLEVNWERFWGFRLALSQWIDLGRSPAIKVTSALTATDGMLDFPTFEGLLPGRLLGIREVIALEEYLFHLACAKLKEIDPYNSPDRSWASQHAAESVWLYELLCQLDPDYERGGHMPPWLSQQLINLFTAPRRYGLLHFACHCLPGNEADPDSERHLLMHIGGGQIHLDKKFITNYLSLKDDPTQWTAQDPGGLVFLNACASGQQLGAQFPELPHQWIKHQGASAVIATLCEVPDIFAYAFALKLYQTLAEAQHLYARALAAGPDPEIPRDLYLEEAVLATRRFFMDKFNNPLGLAYELYAFPDACVEPGLGEGE